MNPAVLSTVIGMVWEPPGASVVSSVVGVTWLTNVVRTAGATTMSVFSTPTLIRRLRDQRWLTAGWSVVAAISFTGLLLVPSAQVLWVVIGGLASGASLVLALSFFGLRTAGAPQAAALSGMAQSVGYLIAATGPVLMGVVHDSVGGWRLPLLILAVLAIGQLLLGYRAGRAGAV